MHMHGHDLCERVHAHDRCAASNNHLNHTVNHTVFNIISLASFPSSSCLVLMILCGFITDWYFTTSMQLLLERAFIDKSLNLDIGLI